MRSSLFCWEHNLADSKFTCGGDPFGSSARRTLLDIVSVIFGADRGPTECQLVQAQVNIGVEHGSSTEVELGQMLGSSSAQC